MRVYTDSGLQKLFNYAKLGIGLIIFFVLLSQAVRIWNNDPALQEVRQLLTPNKPTHKAGFPGRER
jgi:hypothetical protein